MKNVYHCPKIQNFSLKDVLFFVHWLKFDNTAKDNRTLESMSCFLCAVVYYFSKQQDLSNTSSSSWFGQVTQSLLQVVSGSNSKDTKHEELAALVPIDWVQNLKEMIPAAIQGEPATKADRKQERLMCLRGTFSALIFVQKNLASSENEIQMPHVTKTLQNHLTKTPSVNDTFEDMISTTAAALRNYNSIYNPDKEQFENYSSVLLADIYVQHWPQLSDEKTSHADKMKEYIMSQYDQEELSDIESSLIPKITESIINQSTINHPRQ